MISKNWAQDAANEIAENIRHGDGNELDYCEIIEKHCPFKSNTLYAEIEPDTAYVKVPLPDSTAEQQARNLLERLGYPEAQELTSGDLVELANLISRLIRFEHALNNCEIHAHIEGIKERTACAVCFTEIATKEPPLLQCSECGNTESCAGAMARRWNHGRCKFCASYFKVVRA